MRLINCPLCGSASTKKIFKAYDMTFYRQDEFQLVGCSSCRLVFLNPQPTEEELKKFYPAGYFFTPEDEVRKSVPHFISFDKTKSVRCLKEKGKLLDVGCGQGWFLERMKAFGWQVHGLDASPEACKAASEKVGSENIFQGDFLSLNLAQGYYDVITLWHVIEHLSDPVKALKKIRQFLRDDGQLVILCPNFNTLSRMIFKECWYPLSVPQHLFHFTPKTLTETLRKCGYTVARRKKHFIDPLSSMGFFKESLMRSCGLKKLTMLAPLPDQENSTPPKRGFIWRLIRCCFNAFCFVASFFLSLLGNEEQILIWAIKEKGTS